MANKVLAGWEAYWKKVGTAIAWIKAQPGLPVAEGEAELNKMGLNPHAVRLFWELSNLSPDQVAKLVPIIMGLIQEWIRKSEQASP